MATLVVVEEFAGPAVVGRGGHAMRVLQCLHGFSRLGHDVLFLEFWRDDPGERRNEMISYFAEIVSTAWKPNRSALVLECPTRSLYGLSTDCIAAIAKDAAAVITLAAPYSPNVHPLVEGVRPRILIDQDPGYTQLWAADSGSSAIYGEHDVYCTVGANVGSARCKIPTVGIDWRPIWNPVILDWWKPSEPGSDRPFSTIADWRGYGYLEFEGRILGPKCEEFRKFLDLPGQVREPCRLVLDIDPLDPDLEMIRARGWQVESPSAIRTPDQYAGFIMGSRGEFSCAKGGYVGTRSGWFSDRSACYLAAGRPVVVQGTGFEDVLPVGEGLFAIGTVEEAVEAIISVRQDLGRHAAAARAVAAEHFEATKVLRELLAHAGIN